MSINHVNNVRADITEMLSKMREISTKTTVFTQPSSESSNSFSSLLSVAKQGISEVNQVHHQSEKIKDSYLSGDSNVSMSQVIIASQKSKLAFEGLMTVRNKLLDAYKEIMSMPV